MNRDKRLDDYIITGRESLNLFFRNKKKQYRKFIVQVDSIEENKSRKFENELNRFYTSCGCTTGNYFLITALISFAAYFFISGQAINTWKIILQAFLILLIAAVLGKFVGRLIDGFRFKKTLKRLNHELL